MRVISLGNFSVPFTTETYTARGLRENGCDVVEVQQDHAQKMGADEFVSMLLTGALSKWRVDLCLYTRTHNPTALGPAWTDAWQRLAKAGIVTASYHLDRFWDLEREHLVWDADPLFTVDHCFTADGGNQDRFARAVPGMNHHWLPPGVDRQEAEQAGNPRHDLTNYQVAFIGSTDRYHAEYPQRAALVHHLRQTYGHRRVVFFGHGRGSLPVVRQQALNDVLASVPVIVGDSCFANDAPATTRATNYWSDRIPETMGRGGFLLHPDVPGLADVHGAGVVATYAPGDWDDLDAKIREVSASTPEQRTAILAARRAVILAKHTMTHRMAELLDVCGLTERLTDERQQSEAGTEGGDPDDGTAGYGYPVADRRR